MPQMRMATLSTKRKPTQTARADEDIVDEDIRKVSAARVRRGPLRVWDVCREAAGTWEALTAPEPVHRCWPLLVDR